MSIAVAGSHLSILAKLLHNWAVPVFSINRYTTQASDPSDTVVVDPKPPLPRYKS